MFTLDMCTQAEAARLASELESEVMMRRVEVEHLKSQQPSTEQVCDVASDFLGEAGLCAAQGQSELKM